MNRLPLFADFILSIALCASLAYWGTALFKPQSRPVAPLAQELAASVPTIEAAAGLFGGQADVSRNFQLIGVIAAGLDGVAILSAAGKPPQVVGVGMEAGPGVIVGEVYATYVLLNEGGNIKRIALAESAKAALAISVPASPVPAPVANVSQGQIARQPPPVNHIIEIQTPSQPALAMHVNDEQIPGQKLAAIADFNSHVMNQHPAERRPGGMGRGAGWSPPGGR